MKPYIMIGTPIRARAFIIREFLEAIDASDYPTRRIYLNLKLNNIEKTDQTPQKIKDWIEETNALDRYAFIRIGSTDFKNPPTERNAKDYDKTINNLCYLRNWLRFDFADNSKYSKKCSYLLDLDSDQILNPGTIKKLVSHRKDITGAITKIPYGGSSIWCWNFYDYDPNKKELSHYRNPDLSGGLEQKDAVGGIVLYSRKAVETLGPKLHDGSTGEDAYYQYMARTKYNIPVHVDTSEEVAHVWQYPNGQIFRTIGDTKQ